MEYLNGYLAVLPPDQRKIIIDKIILGSTDLPPEFSKALEAKLMGLSHTPMTQLRLQSNMLDSKAHNKMVGEMFGDLNILFSDSEIITGAILSHHYSNISTLNELKQELKKLEERIKGINIVAENEDVYMVKQEKFTDLSGIETRVQPINQDQQSLFVDRDGTLIPTDCSVDTQAGNATLYPLNTISRLRDNQNKVAATVKVLEKTSTGIAPQTPYSINNIIDDSLETFWSEIALVDQALNVKINDVTSGAIIKFEVSFPTVTPVSEITITPFGHFPIEISKIEFLRDDSSYDIPTKIMEATNATKKLTFLFPSVMAKKLVFTVKQENYVINNYVIPKEMQENSNFWSLITNKEAEVTYQAVKAGTDNSSISEADLDAITGWSAKCADYLTKYTQYKADSENYYKTWVSAYTQYKLDLENYNTRYGTSYQPMVVEMPAVPSWLGGA